MSISQSALVANRKAIESFYDSICTVIEFQKSKNQDTKATEYSEKAVIIGQPCKLSFSIAKAVNQTESAGIAQQTVKLFIAPELSIKAGSKISVTSLGRTIDYTYSSQPAVYPTHQELVLELFKEYV